MRNTTDDVEVVVMVIAEIVVLETTVKRDDKQTSKTGVDEVTMVEEVILQIVQMLNVTILENMNITQRIAMLRRKWKKMQILSRNMKGSS